MAINTHLGKNIDGGWIIYRDSDNAFRTVLTNASGGAAIDTSNTVFSMEFYTPGGTTPKLTLTESDGDIVNDDGGIIDYTLTQEDIATLPRDRYFFVIKYSVSGGDVKPLAQGYTNITSETNPGSTTTSVNMNVNVDGVQVDMAVSMMSLSAFGSQSSGTILSGPSSGSAAVASFKDIGALNIIKVFNVKAFGAVGDGSTDDTVAIQAALDAIPAAGGILYFPPGDFKLTSTITISKRITIAGAGGGGTFNNYDAYDSITSIGFSPSTLSSPAFIINAYAVTIRDLTMEWTSASSPTAGNCALRYTTGQNSRIYNCVFYNFYDGIRVEDKTTEWTMMDCLVTSPHRYGIYINNTTLPDAGDWRITNCAFKTYNRNATSAIRVEGSGGGRITSIKINGPLGVAQFSTGIDVYMTGSTSDLMVTNSSIENVAGDSITLSGTTAYQNITIHGNQIAYFAANQGNGIVIDTLITRLAVVGNVITATAAQTNKYGILMKGNAKDAMISGNFIHTNFTFLVGLEATVKNTFFNTVDRMAFTSDDYGSFIGCDATRKAFHTWNYNPITAGNRLTGQGNSMTVHDQGFVDFYTNATANGSLGSSQKRFRVMDAVNDSLVPLRLKSYTVATVPSASTSGAGAQIFVTDETGGAVLAFSDGTNWRRVTDRAVIS